MSITIKKLDQSTWIFEEPGVRFFLLEGKEKALLIDSGMTTHNAKELAEEQTALPIFLINTHADRDHIGSNDEFDCFYMHPSESTNFYNTQKHSGRFIPVWDGDEIDLGSRKLQIIGIPGHTPGSIAILDKNTRRIFTGDPVQDGRIYMFGVQRDMHSYQYSLQKLWDRREDFDEVYPSHSTCPVDPGIIIRLYDASNDIMSGHVPGIDEEVHGVPVTAYDAGVAVFLCNQHAYDLT